MKVSILFALLLVVSPMARAQNPAEPDAHREMREKMERQQRKALNKERQESLKKDMDRLYQLATELKQSVDKTDENILSLQVISKTEEIEKLAREIRKKMKDAY